MKKTDDPILNAVVHLAVHITIKTTKKAMETYKKNAYNKKNNIYVLTPNKHFTPQ